MSQILSLRLYNTLTRHVEPVALSKPGEARLYCCGVTPYDVSHAGHGRTYVFTDLLVRHLTELGVNVRYVRNLTDVEDKILKRAKERGEEPLDLSARFSKMFQEDVTRLGCVVPSVEPKVSESIPEIVSLIERLIQNGAAYVVDSPTGKDVWYSVKSFVGYGKLSGRSLDEMKSGAGLEDREKALKEGKRDPEDFALWKSSPEGEWAFDSPWGKGRPGWHIECSAMAETHLGFGIDIHAGGMDLIFPHHENEIAQSEGAKPGEGNFAKMWVHGGFLNVDKEKMAKSVGNFVTMRDCFSRNDPEALRYYYLTAHFRGPLEFDTNVLPSGRVVFPGLDEAERRMDYLYESRHRVTLLAGQGEAGKTLPKELGALAEVIRSTKKKITLALDDDLNAPLAIAALAEFAKASNDLADLAVKKKKDANFVAGAISLAHEAVAMFEGCARHLGILQSSYEEYTSRTRVLRMKVRGLDADQIAQKVKERDDARAAKDFARGDAIRAELGALGVELLDSPTGTQWRISA